MSRLLLSLLLLCLTAAALPAREVTLLNNGWRFLRGDVAEAAQPAYDDSRWLRADLPHSFSAPYFMAPEFYTGYGWYRRHLSVTAEDLRERLYLDFEGVFQEAEVYVGGVLAGHHVGGYTGFRVALTPYLRTGDNVIAVRVNNLWRPDVAPRAGEHTFSGGIYRNVRLTRVAPLHVAWQGTAVTTPDLAANMGRSSSVRVGTTLANATGAPAPYRLTAYVVDEAGRRVSRKARLRGVAADSITDVTLTIPPVERPVLWSPETPVRYRVVTLVERPRGMNDRYETPFGFRWLTWTADSGFYLNGRHRYLRGANVHQDQAGWGDAVTDSAAARDVRMMREAGFDFIRGSHYPHSPAFVEACDREGMLFWSELPFWGIGGFRGEGWWDASAFPVNEADRAGFERSALKQLGEMIRTFRNNPSVVAWSMSNEPFFSAPETLEGVRGLLRRLVSESHRLDPTRPAAVGGAQRPLGGGRIDRIGDVAGYNGDGATQPPFQQPGVASLVSEYGSTTADRPGAFGPGWGDLAAGDTWRGYPWRSGQAIWCGFDHGSLAGSALGKMGIVDYFRIPKRSWYWYRQTYAHIAPPACPLAEETGVKAERLRLSASKTDGIRTDGTDDALLTLGVTTADGRLVSAAPRVTLRIISGPGRFPTGKTITFAPDSDIRIADGQAAITVRSYYAGTTRITATADGLRPDTLTFRFTGETTYAAGVTPEPADIPYVRYEAPRTEAPVVQTFGYNNPAFASSCAPGLAAGLATDADERTAWRPAAGDVAPSWTVDTEKLLEVREVTLTFPAAGPYRYCVEISPDGTGEAGWLPFCDRTAGGSSPCTVTLRPEGADPVRGRRVRIRFIRDALSASPALAEVRVKGIVCQ